MSRFAQDSLTLLCTPVTAILVFTPKIENKADVMLHCILGNVYPFTLPKPPRELMSREKLISGE